jgi:hypothetical protein
MKNKFNQSEKELLIELLVERIENIDNKSISYGSQADNEEYKKEYENILEKVKSL